LAVLPVSPEQAIQKVKDITLVKSSQAKKRDTLTEVESFPFPDDWDINNKILDDSVNAFMQDVTINYDYDIPYVAGYNTAGNVVYIDRDLPKGFTTSDGKDVLVERYLVLHECVEKALLQCFTNLIYETSHQLALRLEQIAPPDLDLTPYIDEHDTEVLAKLKQAMAAGGKI
jgi:hypothetical protein